MSEVTSTHGSKIFGCLKVCLLLGCVLSALGAFVLFPVIRGGTAEALASKGCLHAAKIVEALDAYAADHHGRYPGGKSSTEIFQALLDGHYVDEPEIFYLPIPGKVKPETTHLRPENVSWDVTYVDGMMLPDGIGHALPDNVPFVFLTGFRVKYTSGSSSTRREPPPFLSSWEKDYLPISSFSGVAQVLPVSAAGTIPNFIPADFDPKGKTYHQLTPDGELPP